jgi:hypothetical protein
MEKLRKGKRVPHARAPLPPSRAVARRGVAWLSCAMARRGEAWRGCLVLSYRGRDETWRDAWRVWLVNKEREKNWGLTVVSLMAINCDWLPDLTTVSLIAINCDWLPDLTVVSLIVMNCDWLSLTQTFPPEPIYSISARLFPCARQNSFLSFPRCVALCLSPSRTSARTEIGRAGLRNPTLYIETPARGSGQSSFWERLPRLLTCDIGFFLRIETTSSSSWWTFAGLHCGYLPASTEVYYFKEHTMSTSVNRAAGAFGTGPSSRYNLKRLFSIFSMSAVVVVVLEMFISNLSSDKIAHMHIYATAILCVIF